MAILPIIRWPDSRLTTVCSETTGDVSKLAADMLETMYDAPGRGLAAPQIAVLLRVFVMDCTWKEGNYAPRVLINPQMLWMSRETAMGPESCLSLPGISSQISRAQSVRMRWIDLAGVVCEETFIGFAAICAQHEFDHLNGILSTERAIDNQSFRWRI